MASYLGIAAIDAAHKSARRAQDIEATGPTFEREREGESLGTLESERERKSLGTARQTC